MDWNAKYAGFVLAAYLISAAILIALIAYVFLRDKLTRKKLKDMETQNRD